jgi:hypothetical protein
MIEIRRMLLPALLLGAVAGSLPVSGARAQEAARPPAATLRRPESPTLAPDAQGFIRRWLVLEPIRRAGSLGDSAVQAAVRTDAPPGPLTAVPRDGDTVSVGGAALVWHAVDTSLYNVNLYHFAHALSRPTSNVLFWAVTVVDAPRDIPDVRLAIGSNAASVWWLNGTEVIGIYGDRQTVVDDGVSKRLTLRKGPNIIRAAVINAGGATDFCARFLDEAGRPVKGFTVGLEAGGR